jgi:probable F420-dependent oxidoreductase
MAQGLCFGCYTLFQRLPAADPDWVRHLARMLESAGAESLWAPEHVLMAQANESRYHRAGTRHAPMDAPALLPDPLELLSFVAGATTRLRLATGILELPLHSPPVLAKRAATLDALSGGRLMLGIGLGWQAEEYSAVGVPFDERGRRMDEGIQALRALWTQSPASFSGEFTQFERVFSEPRPTRASGIPLIIGGDSEPAIRRTGRFGEGYFPGPVSPDQVGKQVDRVRASAKAAGRADADIHVTVWPGLWKASATFDLGAARAYVGAGATRLLTAAHEAPSTEMEAVERLVKSFRDQIIARV